MKLQNLFEVRVKPVLGTVLGREVNDTLIDETTQENVWDGDFSVAHYELKTMQYMPKEVTGALIISNNYLKTFEFAPRKIGKSLNQNQAKGFVLLANYNQSLSLRNISKYIDEINGHASFIMCENDGYVLDLLNIKNLRGVKFCEAATWEKDTKLYKVQEIINRYLPNGDIFDCQSELMDAGLEEYAAL